MITDFREHSPDIGNNLFLADNAWIIGNVSIKDDCSIFFGAVLRGDINPIVVGKGSNIQEHAVLHTSRGLGPCIVGDSVTVGHRAILHGCEIRDSCIIGMGSTILDNAVVGENCIIGANSLVPMNKIIPPGSMVFGSPAKVVRSLTKEEIESIESSALSYQKLGVEYRKIMKAPGSTV